MTINLTAAELRDIQDGLTLLCRNLDAQFAAPRGVIGGIDRVGIDLCVRRQKVECLQDKLSEAGKPVAMSPARARQGLDRAAA